jgi:small subunit ribosomal protein S13
MARIAGVDLPNKQSEIALTYIFGIGKSSAQKILDSCGIERSKRANELTELEVTKLRNIIENEYKVEGRLRTEVSMNIKRLMEIGTYKGIRHRRGLPVNGQRTKNNSRTRKGRAKTVAGRKKAPAPK